MSKGFSLGFLDRLAYSWLVYRARYGRGVTKSQLAAATGLHRTQTIPRIITRLLNLGLAEWRGRKLFAREPSPDQFSFTVDARRQADPWFKRLNYFTLLRPARNCPLTIMQVAVLCLLYSPNMRVGLRVRPRRKHVAALLRITEKTVRTALKQLEACGLLKDDHLVPPSPEMLDWWHDRTVREKAPAPSEGQQPSWDSYSQWFPKLLPILDSRCPSENWTWLIDRLGRLFEQAGYPFEQVSNALVDAVNALRTNSGRAALIRNAEALVRKAEDRTADYRSRGKFHGPNSSGMFKKMLLAEARRLREKEE